MTAATMHSPRNLFRRFVAPFGLGAALAGLAACIDAAGPGGSDIAFSPAVVELGAGRDTVLGFRNDTDAAVGPVVLAPGPVVDASGVQLPGAAVTVAPPEIREVPPGEVWTVSVSVEVPPGTPDGVYGFDLEARLPDGERLAVAEVSFAVNDAAANAEVAAVAIVSGPTEVRQGDVTAYAARATDGAGRVVDGARIAWRPLPADAGVVGQDGRLVAYAPGTLQLEAQAGAATDTLEIAVTPRGLSGTFDVVGRGVVADRFTSDLWVLGGTAYTGTWRSRTTSGGTRVGNLMYAWDVSDPADPVRSDSVIVDATVVNDVKIRSDGGLAVLTHEGSADGRNGITLLDISDPLHPTVLSRFTASLETGVHNVWLDGDHVYVAADGEPPTGGLRVVDVSDPSAPFLAASFDAGTSFLHDVSVRDGLAFLSYWNGGLIILDVGNGIAGGGPGSPVEVGRITTEGGQAHNAWYWPDAGYVFVGEEDFSTPGKVHVVDVTDLRRPREVATFRVPGTTPHNFWLDEGRGILYAAWYTNGLRAVDVSGELLGELDRQGREIAALSYGGAEPACPGATSTRTCTWAPQEQGGLVYLSDMNTGLWIVRPRF